MQLSDTCEFWWLKQDFQQTIFWRSWRYLDNVTYYILAAQTIHFEFYIERNKFFADHSRSVGAWRWTKHLSLAKFIQETSNFINCKSLTESFSKYGHFVNAVKPSISNSERLSSFKLQQNVYPYSKFIISQVCAHAGGNLAMFSVLPIKSFNQGSNKRECRK